MDDWQLLQNYAKRGSEEALFRALVERHLPLVHAAALRQVNDAHLAQEVTQAVFILLAQKAGSMRAGVLLPGWLFRTTRFVATRAARSERRRREREQEAFEMQQTDASVAADLRLSPLLDEALLRLHEMDRNALLLRFAQERSLRDVGRELGLSEEATRKRVSRALERLRSFFARRGFTVSSVVLAGVLSRRLIATPPEGLANCVAAKSIADCGLGSGSEISALVRETLNALFGVDHPRAFRIEANAPFEVTVEGRPVRVAAVANGKYASQCTIIRNGLPAPLMVEVKTDSSSALEIHTAYSTDSDPTRRPLPFSRLLVPWAPPHQPVPVSEERKVDLVGGDYERGLDLFFGERLKCGPCHRLRGEGATIGPDLSNLIHRDAASVHRDIAEPSATINPDYVAYTIQMHDGTTINGFVHTQAGDVLRVTLTSGIVSPLCRGLGGVSAPQTVFLTPINVSARGVICRE